MADLSGRDKGGVSFTWKIENFFLSVKDKFLESPKIVFRIDDTATKFRFLLFTSRKKDHIECSIDILGDEVASMCDQPVCVSYELSCITADGKTMKGCSEDGVRYFVGHGLRKIAKWNWSMLEKKRSLYFPDDSFTIQYLMWSCSQQVTHPVEYVAVTNLEVTNISVQRDIHDFDSLYNNYSIKCSPLIDDHLDIKLIKNEGSDVSIELHWTSSTMQSIGLNCKLSVLNYKGIILNEMEGDHFFHGENKVWKFPCFFDENELLDKDSCLKNFLNLQINFKVYTGKISEKSTISEVRTIPDVSESDVYVLGSLNRELEVLYSEKRYTDVEIRVGEVAFPAHKLILRARSPVFAAMFDNDMLEKETSVVHIDDVDDATFGKFLSYLYSEVVKDLQEDMAIKLLSLADKYQVPALKKKCSTFLVKNLSMQNACLMLQLGDIHREESLKKTAQKFICCHHREILSSDEWRLFVKHHGELASAIFLKLSVRYTNA